jgi:hypothetical protein
MNSAAVIVGKPQSIFPQRCFYASLDGIWCGLAMTHNHLLRFKPDCYLLAPERMIIFAPDQV